MNTKLSRDFAKSKGLLRRFIPCRPSSRKSTSGELGLRRGGEGTHLTGKTGRSVEKNPSINLPAELKG